jgi:hypothetical protein
VKLLWDGLNMMRTLGLLVILIVVCSTMAIAAPREYGEPGTIPEIPYPAQNVDLDFPDRIVPNWAYDSMQKLAAEGLLPSYPDGYFDSGNLSRYEFALAARELQETLDLKIASRVTRLLADGIEREFSSEIEALDARSREARGETGALLGRSDSIAEASFADRYRIDRLSDLACDMNEPSPFSGAVRYRIGLVNRSGGQDTFQRVDFLLGYREEIAPGVTFNFELGSDWNDGVLNNFNRDPLTGDLKLKRAFVKFSN